YFILQSPSSSPLFSLHDALPIYLRNRLRHLVPRNLERVGHSSKNRGSQLLVRNITFVTLGPGIVGRVPDHDCGLRSGRPKKTLRSEEHTSELQSRENLVCRLLLE